MSYRINIVISSYTLGEREKIFLWVTQIQKSKRKQNTLNYVNS